MRGLAKAARDRDQLALHVAPYHPSPAPHHPVTIFLLSSDLG
jgi:hypothetical protein